ncbi:MAG: tRNA (N6-threonylcarbamoyladenosine(37)-N6)-methyltransferase TrmO [Bacteroidales bacterium]|nr:tRNA (N6-threonylcarbamoyladenosine(37)-N6)-methyltransferase TrmO [Bacteroidales bacterium]
MKKTILLLFLTIPFGLIAQEAQEADALVSPRIAKREITVGGDKAHISGYSNQSIQSAIDALEKTGGTVILNPGHYTISAPVRLKSNVDLIGSGEETVLKRERGIQKKYIVDADYGELKLTVEDSDDFEIGMKVQVTDDKNSGCWNVSTAYITDIENDVIYIDRGLIRDYRSDLNGLLSNASSVIEVIEAENSSISNLVIDGNRSENFFADGCNSAGVLIFKSKKIVVDHVQVKDFNGEGISWQITEHVTVKNCEISGSGNTGLHPGTGSPFSIIENNDVHHNDRDGLFICWRVYQSRVTGNKFHHNGRFGLCTGHKDSDVLFENNHIFENRSDGVHLRGEREANAPHRNRFTGNTIENNGTVEGGYGFSINSPAEDLVLKENVFKNSTGSQKAAIYVHEAGLKPDLNNNQFDKHELGELIFETPVSKVKPEQPLNPDAMMIDYQPIGEFHTDLSPQTGAPRQGVLVPENRGIIEIYPAYEEAMQGLGQYEYIIVLYHMHMSKKWYPVVRPPSSNREFGLFATRSPNRPNSIGLGVIKLEKVTGRQLHVSGIDAYNGTPVLDIKPWLPSIDCPDRQSNLNIEKDLGIKE